MTLLLVIVLILAVILYIYFSNTRTQSKNPETIILKTADGYIRGHMLDSGIIKGQKFIAEQLAAEGVFVNGLQIGQGKTYYKNGRIRYEGHFVKDQPSGEGRLYEEDGRLKYIGHFEKGYATGQGKIFDDKGHIKIEGQFRRVAGFDQFSKDPSLPFGHCREYYSSGKVKYDGEFENGVWHGKGKYYDPFGKLVYRGEFFNGKPKAN